MSRRGVGHSLGAAALMAALCVYGCSTTPAYRTAEERSGDEATAARVREALRQDPVLYDAHIAVTAEGGVVRLSGVLSEAEDIYEVRRIAKAVPGVTRVVSDLKLVDRR